MSNTVEMRNTEILTTIEAIERTNEAIKRHKSVANPDIFSIEQFQRFKADLVRQLYELLAPLEIEYPSLVVT